jgi:hypothetical protein
MLARIISLQQIPGLALSGPGSGAVLQARRGSSRSWQFQVVVLNFTQVMQPVPQLPTNPLP